MKGEKGRKKKGREGKKGLKGRGKGRGGGIREKENSFPVSAPECLEPQCKC